MYYKGVLKKMKTEWLNPVRYYLIFKDDYLVINQLLNKEITINFEDYECLCCGKNKKIFRQGYCYDCFYESALAGEWIMRPELSKAHLNVEDRDLEYEKSVQLQPHIVYLAFSSNVKVGVTRKTQIPTRWIDQGATQAIEIVEVPNRYLAGITEMALKQYVSDRTSWQKMLKNSEEEDADLLKSKEILLPHIPEETQPYILKNHTKVTHIHYPLTSIPTSVKSLNLEKKGSYSGKLTGIKGQYLLFEDGTVFNIRANEGLVITLEIKF